MKARLLNEDGTEVPCKKEQAYAKAIFTCLPSSHPFIEKEVILNGKIKIGRTYVAVKQAKDRLSFDSKVMSKNHALIWYQNGKFFLKDTKSSNGTFVNGNRLSLGLEESKDFEIFTQDAVQFGVDVTSEENNQVNTHCGIFALLQLFHPDGSPATRPIEYEGVNNFLNISVRQLTLLHDCLKTANDREKNLKEKLACLKLQLTNLEDLTKKKWDLVIDEDLLLSRIETLQNKMELLLKRGQNKSSDNSEIINYKKEIEILEEQKELYQIEFKTIIKKTIDEKKQATSKVQELEYKLNYSQKGIELLENCIKNLENEISSLNSQKKFLDEELVSYKLKTKELLNELKNKQEEKLNYENEQKNHINDIQNLNCPNCDGKFIEKTNNLQNDLQKLNTHENNEKIVENGDIYSIDKLEEKKLPDISLISLPSQKFLKLIDNFFDPTILENQTIADIVFISKHALSTFILELNENLKKIHPEAFITSNLDHSFNNVSEILNTKLNYLKKIINEKDSLMKENNKLEKEYSSLLSKFKELKIQHMEVSKKEDSKNLELEIQNVINSVIENVENNLYQEELSNKKEEIFKIQSNLNKLEKENEILKNQNDLVCLEKKRLKEELNLISYQNKIAHLMALIPIAVLIVSIILAYLPIISVATGTKEV